MSGRSVAKAGGQRGWPKLSFLRPPNSLAQRSQRAHNHGMKTYVGIMLALAFCASAFAQDPSKNVVARSTQQVSYPQVVKICYVKTVASGIPLRCTKLEGAFPTTSSNMEIIGREQYK